MNYDWYYMHNYLKACLCSVVCFITLLKQAEIFIWIGCGCSVYFEIVHICTHLGAWLSVSLFCLLYEYMTRICAVVYVHSLKYTVIVEPLSNFIKLYNLFYVLLENVVCHKIFVKWVL